MSTAATTFTDDDLATLLMNSRANNRRSKLTGLLLHEHGQFLQVLEGPTPIVESRYGVIGTDPRHRGLVTLLREKVDERQFPNWTMGYQPVIDTLADQIPGYRDLFNPRHAPLDDSTPVPAVRDLLRWFHRTMQQPAPAL